MTDKKIQNMYRSLRELKIDYTQKAWKLLEPEINIEKHTDRFVASKIIEDIAYETCFAGLDRRNNAKQSSDKNRD